MMNSMRLGWAVVFALHASACMAAQTRATDSASVEHGAEVVQRMRTRYEHARSYRDTGTIHLAKLRGPNASAAEELESFEFQTAYVRSSGAFFFEYRAADSTREWNRGVVWRRNVGATDSWSPSDVVRTGGLADVLSSFSGVSHRVSVGVPGLLLAPAESELTKPAYRAEGEERIGAHRCFKLVARDVGETLFVWVDTRSFALRRIVREQVLEPPEGTSKTFVARLQVDYSPAFDESIDEVIFDFSPP